jgi:AraC family transcriptional regulator
MIGRPELAFGSGVPVDAEHMELSSTITGPLGGTHIGYELERQVRLDFGVVELGRFRWPYPIEQVLRHEDDFFGFNLALSPRPRRARISSPGRANEASLESIGRVLLLFPGSPFRLSVPAGHVRCLYCGIDRARVEAFTGREFEADELTDLVRSRVDAVAVELLLNRIYDELRDPRFASEQAIAAYATALCVELARAIRDDDGPVERSRGGLPPWRMRLLTERIHAEAPAPHLTELADLCGMTVRQLGRAFKEETGKTLGKYIDEVIVERASRLLLDTDAPIADIAAALGFSTSASFAYSFRRSTGLAPSELRKRGAIKAV